MFKIIFFNINRQRLLLFGDDKKFTKNVHEERFASKKLPPVEVSSIIMILF